MATNDYLVKKMLHANIAVTIMVTLTATLSMVINGIIVGRFLGADALTAFGLASPMFILLGAFAGIFSNGGTIKCAEYMGRGDYEKVKENFSVATAAAIVVGILYSGVCLLLGGFFGDALGGGGDIPRLTAEYIRALGLCGVPFLILQNLLLYLRMDNNQKLALVAMGVSVGLNAVFAFYSAKFTGLGIFGIGLSLLISSIGGVVISLFHFTRKDRILHFAVPHGCKKELYDICMAGLPTAINRGSQTLKNLVLNIFLMTFGTTAVLTLSVQTNVYQFFIAISSGYGIMTAMMTGMFFGEKDKGSITNTLRACMISGVIVSIIAGVVMFVFADGLAKLFIKSGGDIEMAARCLRFFALSQPTSTIALVLLYMYQSMGDLVLSNIISFTRGAVYVILVSLAFAPLFGLDAVWISFFFADILAVVTVMAAIKIRTGKFPKRWSDYVVSPKAKFDAEEICNVSVKNDINEVMGLADKMTQLFAEKGIDADKANRIALCIEEMAGNSVDFAFKDKDVHYIDIRVIRSGDDIIFRMRDDGVMFNPLSEESDEHLGIRTVRATAKTVSYRYSVGMNNLTVTV